MPENRMLIPKPSSKPTSSSLIISRPYSARLSVDGIEVFKNTGATRSDIATASTTRTCLGIDIVPKIGAVITSVPVRASTSVNTMKRLTRNVSSVGMLEVRTPTAGQPLHRVGDIGNQ